jgi:signal transduction histidine kinase
MRQSKLIVGTGFLMWAACSVPALFSIWKGEMSGWQAIAWWLAFVVFGLGLTIAALSGWFGGSADTRNLALLSILLLSAFAMTFNSLDAAKYMSSLTLITAAGRLPYVVSLRTSWLATIGIALIVIVHYAAYGGWPVVLTGGGAVTAGLVFIVNHSLNDLREREARAALLALNAELHATRGLLAEHSRAAERLRISRDLHDTLGHHLTGLSIQLDVAARRSEGPAA